MCEPISMGIAIGAATGAVGAAITGGDPLQGAVMGGITGGFTGGMGGVGAESWGAQAFSDTFINQIGMGWMPAGLSAGGMLGFGIAGLATSVGAGLLMPKQQDYSQYYNQAGSDPIAYNTQQSVVTGSGGRQASANLAEEIKRAKTRRAAQADVGNIDLATSLSNTGLQIA